MKLKFAPILLSALSVATMSAQSPTTSQEIYSLQGNVALDSGHAVAYSFGSWHAGDPDGEFSAFSPLFEELLENLPTNFTDMLEAEAQGISVSWDNIDRALTVSCSSDKLGRTSVLVASTDGASRGLQTVNESPAVISLANYSPGVYAIAVAVDGKLIKSIKINLK